MKQIFWLILLVSVIAVTGCTKKPVEDVSKSITSVPVPLELPATFNGEIPCPDCDTVKITLNLRPDNIYQLRKTYMDKGTVKQVESQMRRWRYVEEGSLIILGKQKGSLKTYNLVGDELKFLDLEGTDSSTRIEYSLWRNPVYDTFPDAVKMRGMYGSSDGKVIFEECSTGKQFEVVEDADGMKLKQEFINTPHGKGESLLASIEGVLQGDIEKESLRVEQFNRFYPEQDCSGQQEKSTLTGTRWQLIEVEGKFIEIDPEVTTPYFILEAKDNKVKGHAGCNRFFGTYLVKGDVFVFNKIAATRMLCPKGSVVEDQFFDGLDATEAYRIEGNILLLQDKYGDTTLTLKAIK